TSLVAAATGKLDGMMFVAGALLGVGLFGESLPAFESFFLSGDMGRFTLSDWLGLPIGAVLVLVVVMALTLFVGAEALERRARADVSYARDARTFPLFRRLGAATLLLAALLVAVRGQPSAEARLAMNPALQRLEAERAMFVDPAEVVALRKDLNLHVDVLDLRSEAEFNLFHLAHAERVSSAALFDREFVRRLQEAEPTTVTFLLGRNEAQALAAWRELRTRGVLNLYIVEGGVDHWLDLYPVPDCVAERVASSTPGTTTWRFRYANGSRSPSAAPELAFSRRFAVPCSDVPANASSAPQHEVTWPEHTYTSRVKLQRKTLVKGGCG
ncbi:MAG TPA: rhodanese-like domain-containing protein, partial [Polyangiaceae bacterium]|nr:rhodanese-like domain-containing protein [Polyangiaceae bacterium]